MIRTLALAALLLASASAHARLQVAPSPGLAPAERQATEALLAEAGSRLPAAWIEALDRPIALEWRDDLPEGVHGRATHWRILLDRRLLRETSAHTTSPAADAPASPALAALLHELAHLYDRTPAGGLSRDPRLLDLAGWQVAVPGPRRSGRNRFSDRSPDAYELASPREFVAVNLEHYLLDPEYACRRPQLAAYFDAHFGHAPPGRAACEAELAFVQDPAAGATPLQLLDPARIHAVDYLLAEGGEGLASRWGHAMLRLVVCAPGRAPGPDCRLDLQHHLVLSFRAFVDDLQISSWRGLAGGYPSRLYVLPLEQVVDEYTRVELRDLRSLPLALDADERTALARRAARLHWSYDGRYRFIDNNCAVETWKLLHDALPRLAALPLRSITPHGLGRRLKGQGLLDLAAIPADADQQLRLGFRFESAGAHYAELYAVAREELQLEPADAGAWMESSPAARAEAVNRAGLRGAAALLVLETAALRREQALARDQLKRRWLRRAGDPGLVAELRQFLQAGDAFGRPASWLDGLGGYGLPQAGERMQLQARLAEAGERRHRGARQLEQRVRELLPAVRRTRLVGTEANLARLGDRLRVLAEQAQAE